MDVNNREPDSPDTDDELDVDADSIFGLGTFGAMSFGGESDR